MARRGRPRPGGASTGRRRRPNRPRPQAAAGPYIPDTAVARLEAEAIKDVARMTKLRAADAGLMEDERLLARVLDQHPEWDALFASAGSAIPTGELESAFVHVALHRIVEQRVVQRQGAEVSKLAAEMSWHDAVHAASRTVAEELFGADAFADDEEAAAEA